MRPVILYRRTQDPDDDAKEMEAIKHAGFEIFERRSHVPDKTVVIGRYSVLPFYRELDDDLLTRYSYLVNYPQQHQYIADLKNWYRDLQGLTPRTWFRFEDVPDDIGPMVLKGETNSRKDRWSEMMYAPDRGSAINIMLKLQGDSLIGTQQICFREFEEFWKVGEGVGGCPVNIEFRFFIYNGEVMASGFYWSAHLDLIKDHRGLARLHRDACDFVVEEVIPLVHPNLDNAFYVVDVALRKDLMWRVVEMNDGQMSGLSCVDPVELYTNLYLSYKQRNR